MRSYSSGSSSFRGRFSWETWRRDQGEIEKRNEKMNEKMRKIFRHKPNRKKMDVKKVAPSQSQRKTLSKECRGAVLARD